MSNTNDVVKTKEQQFLIDNKHYYCRNTLQYILKDIVHYLPKNQLKVIGIDADSGYGKSYTARYLNEIINSHKNLLDSSLPYLDQLEHVLSIYIPIDQEDYDTSFTHILYVIYSHIYQTCTHNNINVSEDDLDELTNELLESMKILGNEVIKKCSGIDFYKFFNERSQAIKGIRRPTEEDKKLKQLYKHFKKLFEILSEQNLSIILIIDNIDRCNPRFVMSFLEVFKYIFKEQKILLLFMINFEYIQNLGEGIYGKNTDMHHFYNLSFTKVKKMYLKDRKKFVEDFIENKSLPLVKMFYEEDQYFMKGIHDINENNHLSLHEIEESLKKLEFFLEHHCYLKNSLKKTYERRYFEPHSLIILIYSFITLQLHDIKLFNNILYENNTLKSTHKLKSKAKKFKRNTIYLVDNLMVEWMENGLTLQEQFQKPYYLSDSSTSCTIENYQIVYCELQDNNVCLQYKNSTMKKYVQKDQFSILHLFNWEDACYNSLTFLMNFTFKEYLRFKISQL